MAVEINYIDEIMQVRYAENKRPIKIEVFVIESDEHLEFVQQVIRFLEDRSNAPHHIAKMDDAKLFALVERMTMAICSAFSPKANCGVSKEEVRGIVLFTYQAATVAGEWPESYKLTDTTFVQRGGDKHGE